ncbi:MAG: regulatory iron-sulfur-containing complex subunit RicT [Dehalococcoidia bacterium]|nr:hypothetical protein [Dehalococcoidia bacterium]MCB9486444.1 hypothetical protein [Thermoflexaceae bacterium]
MTERTERVAGVRFRNAGKIFYFDTAGIQLEPGEYVVVETVRGPEVARVVIGPGQVVVNELRMDDLQPILRMATDEDIEKADVQRRRATEILPEARRLAEEAGFRGRIDAADFTLDGRRLTFSFASEDRLDYREYVRRASKMFDTRVDMRQIGARDRAKLAGGYGICGRELCCANWLDTFPAISIRMAKEQELPLNPQKISGLCGRLLCCLSYEEEGYKEMRKTLPKLGQRCSTPTGEGRVISVNILKRQVTLIVQGQRLDVPDADLGTVVRWDPSSRTAEPPPSLGRPEPEPGDVPEPDWITTPGPIRERPAEGGRLPQRRPPQRQSPRPAADSPAQRSGRPSQGRPQPRPAQRPASERPPQRPAGERPAPLAGAQSRTFRRAPRPESAAGPEPQDSNRRPAGEPGSADEPRGRRRRRGGPRPGGSGSAPD